MIRCCGQSHRCKIGTLSVSSRHHHQPSSITPITSLLSTQHRFSSTQTTSPPPPSRIPSRPSQLSRLSSSTPSTPFDLIVVGGGATGAGTALDAASRGLSVALIERHDFSSETSSRSTKLIWAGIRYIATAFAQLLSSKSLVSPVTSVQDFVAEFRMVLNCHKERRLLLENNPHLTNWVPIAIPMPRWISWPAPFGNALFSITPLIFPLVMKFYDSLCGFNCPPSHIMGKSRARRKFPQLDEDFKYVQVFYEGQHNDARTATCIALTAAEEGACVANYCEMTGIIVKDEANNGATTTATGITCRDNLTGDTFDIHGKAIVFAGGPFTDALRKMEDPHSPPAVSAAAGTHIVLPGYYCPDNIGLLDINTSDGRFLFFLPWEGSVVVGTTDRKGKATSCPGPPEDDIGWILREAEKYLSDDLKVRRADVLSAWQGWRPLASDPHKAADAPVSRDHIISTHPETKITFVTGGKWTTYREMAEEVVDKVIEERGDLKAKAKPCRTESLPLRGGVGYTKNLPIQLIQKYGVSGESARHLARTYGMNAFEVCELAEATGKRWPRFGKLLIEGYPYLDCEVEYAIRNEMAVTVKDMLALRTRLAFLNIEAAKEIVPKVADLMGAVLKWDESEKGRQIVEAMEFLSSFGGPSPNKDDVIHALPTMTDITSVFELFDMDKNGYIDFQEMKTMSKELGHTFDSESDALESFRKMDADNNGRVGLKEFADWWHDEEREDVLRRILAKNVKYDVMKIGKGPGSRGVAFG